MSVWPIIYHGSRCSWQLPVWTKQPFLCQFLWNISQIFVKDLHSYSERKESFCHCITLFSCFTYRLPTSPLRALGIFFDWNIGQKLCHWLAKKEDAECLHYYIMEFKIQKTGLSSNNHSVNDYVFACPLWSSQINETPFRSYEFRLHCFLDAPVADTGRTGLGSGRNGGRERTHLSHSPVLAQVKHCACKD